ncbi:sugE protein [Bacillus sp. XF8]|nr:sugE protein [Bacillus sp. XF8]
MSLRAIQLSTAYAVWTGIGTLGAAIVGIVFFREPKNTFRIFCIIGIMGIIASLRLLS